ncbi:MAG TPA: hypothetical protein DCY53_05075 [Desulfobacteraceae bacterium]|nr:hypothetical protein [Desulfobacteraceae bacterium]
MQIIEIVIPNSIVGSNAVVNFHHTDTRCCKIIEIGIGYGSDIDKALSIMVTEVLNHPLYDAYLYYYWLCCYFYRHIFFCRREI